MESSVSFTSRIRPATLTEFTRLSEPLYNSAFVRHPWTAKETIAAEKAFTMDVYDCTAGGIVDETGKKVVMFHICPEMSANKCFGRVEQMIMEKLDDAHGKLRAFLTGSNKMFQDSKDLYENLRQMLVKRNIPISELKGTGEKTHVLYDGVKDEWIVTNSAINDRVIRGEASEKILGDCFDRVVVDSKDVIA